MKRQGAGSTILLGAVFLASAVLKAVSFLDFAAQVSYYGILRDPFLVQVSAAALIAFEGALGTGLLLLRGARRQLLLLALLLLTGFSLLIGWAWAFRGLEECGCFGKFLEIGPGVSLLKNAALGLMAALAWTASRAQARRGDADLSSSSSRLRPGRSAALALTLATGAILAGVAAYQAATAPAMPPQAGNAKPQSESSKDRETGEFSQYRVPTRGSVVDLSKGLHLVAMLSEECATCRETVSHLNEYGENSDLPRIVAFVLSDDPDLEEFRKKYGPNFPTRAMAPLEFLERIGNAPPRFVLVRDGRSVKHWDGGLPSEVDLAESVLGLP